MRPVCVSVIGTSAFPDMPSPISKYTVVHIRVFDLKALWKVITIFCFVKFFSSNIHLHHHVLLLPVCNQDQPEWGHINNWTQAAAALIGQCPNHLRKVATARWVDMPIVFTHSAMAIVILWNNQLSAISAFNFLIKFFIISVLWGFNISLAKFNYFFQERRLQKLLRIKNQSRWYLKNQR